VNTPPLVGISSTRACYEDVNTATILDAEAGKTDAQRTRLAAKVKRIGRKDHN